MITRKLLLHAQSKYHSQLKFIRACYLFSAKKHNINPSQNYYAKLNIRPNATLPQIKKGYYEMTKKYHPDSKTGDQQIFKQIKQAYEILSNSQLRKQYDQLFSKNTTKQGQTKEQYVQNSGPYQTDQQYYKNTSKPYYNNTPDQWRKTRLGYRPQSYVWMHSQMQIEKGAERDQDLIQYLRKKKALEANRNVQEKQLDKEYVEQRMAFLQKRHQQRFKKLEEELMKKHNQMTEKSLFNRILGFFSSKNKMEQVKSQESKTNQK